MSSASLMAGRPAGRRSSAERVGQPYRSTKLYVKISECKNLPAKDLNGFSDPYCLLVVDDETIARTSTIWKDLNPFFGEEFYVDMAQDFQEMAVYVYDQDTLKSDDSIGKVTFSRKQIEGMGQGVDTWHALVRLTRDTETAGEVLVRLLLSETATGLDELTVTVVCARDLKESGPDYFCIVQLDGERQMTDRIKGTRAPVWKSSFKFERAKLGPDLHITVRGAAGLGSTFVGEAVLQLGGLERDVARSEWARLRPRAKDLEGMDTGNGSIRLTMRFTHELILPLETYTPLVKLLVASVQTREDIEAGTVAVLDDLLGDREVQAVVDREQVARTLIRILLHSNCCTLFLRMLNGIEISKCKEYSTLFRGNSMATKCTDQFMKIVGLRYLSETIKPVIDVIFRERKDCEIDPTKLPAKKVEETIHKHSLSLIRYLEDIFTRVFESADRCPHIMRLVFRHLQEGVRKNPNAVVGDAETAIYTVVSGFHFLRFFAPAVLSPKLFGIRDELADASTSRTLTLLAKAIQVAGNLGSTIGSGKEAYMAPLYPALERIVERVRAFIDRICGVRDTSEADLRVDEEASVAEIMLIEGAVQYRDAVNKAFKKRDAAVTPINLTLVVAGKPDQTVTVPITSIVAVERIDASAIGQKNAIQIVCSGRPSLCLALPSASEEALWLQAFRKATRLAKCDLLHVVHSGVSKDAKWTCCKGRGEEAFPCSKAHSSVCIDQFADNPGPEVWAHKLYAMLQACRPKLEARYRGGQVAPADAGKAAHVAALLAVIEDINLSQLLHQDAAPAAADMPVTG